MSTLLLGTNWDITVDALGNISTVDGLYSTAQDVACAIKLFQGELYYNQSKGIPYFRDILGKYPPRSLMVDRYEKAAKTVAGVVSSRLVVNSISDRVVHGALLVTDSNGNLINASF